MDLRTIVEELKKERDRINRAIAILEGAETPKASRSVSVDTSSAEAADARPVNRLTPERKKKISQTMKKLWAEKKRKAS